MCDLIWVFSGNRSLTPIRSPAGASRDRQFLRGGLFPFLYSSSSSSSPHLSGLHSLFLLDYITNDRCNMEGMYLMKNSLFSRLAGQLQSLRVKTHFPVLNSFSNSDVRRSPVRRGRGSRGRRGGRGNFETASSFLKITKKLLKTTFLPII